MAHQKPSKSSKSSSSSRHSQQTGSSKSTEAWVYQQAVSGPWDGVGEVVGSWSTASPGVYSSPASMTATQGSSKKPKPAKK